MGFDLEFIPDAEIIHLGGQSAVQSWNESEVNDKKIKMIILFEKKHTGKFIFLVNLLTRIFIECVRIPFNLLMGRNILPRWKLIKIYFYSIFINENSFISQK